jgi:hypothetical protein
MIQKVKMVDVRILKKETKAAAASKDLQNISTLIALAFSILKSNTATEQPALANALAISLHK